MLKGANLYDLYPEALALLGIMLLAMTLAVRRIPQDFGLRTDANFVPFQVVAPVDRSATGIRLVSQSGDAFNLSQGTCRTRKIKRPMVIKTPPSATLAPWPVATRRPRIRVIVSRETIPRTRSGSAAPTPKKSMVTATDRNSLLSRPSWKPPPALARRKAPKRRPVKVRRRTVLRSPLSKILPTAAQPSCRRDPLPLSSQWAAAAVK